jgi:hypothetical protein
LGSRLSARLSVLLSAPIPPLLIARSRWSQPMLAFDARFLRDSTSC